MTELTNVNACVESRSQMVAAIMASCILSMHNGATVSSLGWWPCVLLMEDEETRKNNTE
jgi:hypothetical protein